MVVLREMIKNIMPLITRRVDKTKKGNTGWWSDKQRKKAVATYLVLGKISLVSNVLGIPEVTLRKWKSAEWWQEAEDELRRGDKLELKGKLGNIVNATLVQLEDRVANGDYIWNSETKNFDRKPITAAVANKITSDLIDRSVLLEKQAEKKMESNEGLDARLQRIAEELVRFSKSKLIEGERFESSLPVKELNPL
jgi:hypothetical protein